MYTYLLHQKIREESIKCFKSMVIEILICYASIIRETFINVREYQRGNQKGQPRERSCQHSVHSTKKNHNTICAGHHYTETNTNNVNMTSAILQTTGGKDYIYYDMKE